ncbi:MAG: hypothetical protein E6G97_01225 [Alphaproteobacteria bacterium]|nr:MAG: hypothetical protein E6G97_01225 [Alphaproteobacteria bacterium]
MSALQRAGLIRYTRGNIAVLDAAGLKQRSCECCEISKREFDRLLVSARGAANDALTGRRHNRNQRDGSKRERQSP